MPMYEYQCPVCKAECERYASMSEYDSQRCESPTCEAAAIAAGNGAQTPKLQPLIAKRQGRMGWQWSK